jgi:hypothetical protein
MLNVERSKEIDLETKSISSVEIKTDSKGHVQWRVKVYNDDAITASNIAVRIEDQLRKKYGNNSEFTYGEAK